MPTAHPANGWLLREPDPDAAERIICVPYLGTGASMFHGWPRMLGTTELCPVQPPGRENRLREASFETYEDFAADLVATVEPYLDRPLAIFAHCNSVYVAYEIVRRLDRLGLPVPTRLIASSMVPPSRMPFGSILQIPEEDLGDVVVDLMQARGLNPDPELVELALDPMIADVRACRAYQPDPRPLPCPVTALGWSRDTSVPPNLVAGWRDFGAVEVHILAGDHWTFLECPDDLRAVLSASVQAGSAH
jgi:surfactin synthase thioesterase subunit